MKYIIWDWNGTLFNDVDASIEAMNRLLLKYQLSPIKNNEDYRSLFSFPVQNYYERLGFNFSQTSFKILAKEYMTIYRELNPTCRLTAGAEKTLSEFKKMGFKQIILSVSSLEDLIKQTEMFNIASYFDEILGIDNIYAKTKTQIAKIWRDSLPSSESIELYLVGDTQHDLDVAKEIGASCFLYTGGHQEISGEIRMDKNGDPGFFPIDKISSVLQKINRTKENQYEVLKGGNMNQPLKKNNRLYKEANKASQTIDKLLKHVRNKGIDWVPQPFGIDKNGKHVLSYLEGFVANTEPDWLWEENILSEAAIKLRQWHDATEDFSYSDTKWLLPNDEPNEVICHSDFAPYNCVFQDDLSGKNHLTGLIDFDVCAPGSRLWDISYALYRFVPLRPHPDLIKYPSEVSPFNSQRMKERLNLFLKSYSMDNKEFLFTMNQVIPKIQKRLIALSEWSRNFGEETANIEIQNDAKMYRNHADWIMTILDSST